MSNLSAVEVWSENRDGINIVVGAILGTYLGFSITSHGMPNGSKIELFGFITCTAYTACGIISLGNRWFSQNRWVGLAVGMAGIPAGWGSVQLTKKLGLDSDILLTIYASWVFLVVANIAAHEVAEFMKKGRK